MDPVTSEILSNVIKAYRQPAGAIRDKAINDAMPTFKDRQIVQIWLNAHPHEVAISPTIQDLQSRIINPLSDNPSPPSSFVASTVNHVFMFILGLKKRITANPRFASSFLVSAINYVFMFVIGIKKRTTGDFDAKDVEKAFLSGNLDFITEYFSLNPEAIIPYTDLLKLHLSLNTPSITEAIPLLKLMPMNILMEFCSTNDSNEKTKLHDPATLQLLLPVLLEKLSTKDLQQLLSIRNSDGQIPMSDITAEMMASLSKSHCLRLAAVLTNHPDSTQELMSRLPPFAYTYHTLLLHADSYDMLDIIQGITSLIDANEDEKDAALAHFIEFGKIPLSNIVDKITKKEFLRLGPHLRYADFEGFSIEQIHLAQELLRNCPNVNTLVVRFSSILEGVSALPHCQTLDCSGCFYLEALPALPLCQTLDCSQCIALTALPALSLCQTLNCSGCRALKALPALPHCQTLDCHDCSALTALPDLPECQTLNCSGCRALKALPALPHCQTLDCHDCSALTALPALPLCHTLNCSGCRVTALPELPLCQKLNCSDCFALRALPALPQCQTLDCSGCRVTALPALPLCQTLNCSRCSALTALPELPQCQTLNCSECSALTALPALPQCQTLHCSRCHALTALPALPLCQTLNCCSCSALTALPDLPECQTLDCSRCSLLAVLPALPHCQTLDCHDCSALAALPALPHCQTLDCHDCSALAALPALPLCQTLDCSRCLALTALSALPLCQTLYCSGCSALTDLTALPHCQTLNCYWCPALTALPALPHCQTLNCYSCRALTALPDLSHCQTLNCSDCFALTALPALPLCQTLNCSDCFALTALPTLPLCQKLDCRSCGALTALPALPECQILKCRGCRALAALPALPLCQTLNCSECSALTTLPALPLCQTLNCSECSALTALPALPLCRRLDYSNCPGIREIPEVPFGAEVVSESATRFLTFKVDVERFATDPKALILLLGEFLLNNSPFPNVNYFSNGQPSQGIDAGGVRRDFVTRLSENLFKKDLEKEDSGKFLCLTEEGLPKAIDGVHGEYEAYRTLGVLFALCYAGATNFKTGPLFAPRLYQILTAPGEPGSDKWFAYNYLRSQYNSPTIIEALISGEGELPKLELSDLAKLAYIEDDESPNYEQFTQDYLSANRERIRQKLLDVAKERLAEEKETMQTLRAISWIAKEMKGKLGGATWGRLRAKGAEFLQNGVEGVLNAPLLKSKLIWDPSPGITQQRLDITRNYLETWIDQASLEQLSAFVRFVTGCKTLSTANLRMEVYDRESDRLPAAHTCYYSLELSGNYENQEQFNEKLQVALAHGMCGTGFTFA